MYVRITVNIREWCEQVETAIASFVALRFDVGLRFGGKIAVYFVETYDFYRCTTAGAAALVFVWLHE